MTEADWTAKMDPTLRVSDPERISAARYHDRAFYDLECRYLWPKVWQMACRLEEIPELGDFVEYQILDQSILVIRTADGVSAYHNACRHRGVQLAKGHGNCRTRGLICPFHGWRWNMEGKNTFVFADSVFSKHNLDPVQIDLKPCRVELWAGCAFINLDDNAPPLRDCIGETAERLDVRNADQLKVDWWKSTVLPVNWKLAMEAFMESYHVMRTHPQIQSIAGGSQGHDYGNRIRGEQGAIREMIDMSIRNMQILGDGMAGMVYPREVAIAETLRDIELPDDIGEAMAIWGTRLNDEIVAAGRAVGMPIPDLNAIARTHPIEAVQYIFPHYFLLPMFGNMSSYRIRPLGPESCLFELWSLTHYPDDEPRERPVPPVPTAHDDPNWPEIPAQDFSNLPMQQAGLHSMSFEYMRLSEQVEGLISNYHRLIDGFIDGVDNNSLANAASMVCGNLDVPVMELGLAPRG